jgi:hypothetical protein
MEKFCKTGWLDQNLGVCHKGLKSLKKGEECTEDEECRTNINGRTAKCRKPLLSASEKRYCDIEGNDDEWVRAQEAVI